MSAMPDGNSAAELQHDEQQARLYALIPQGCRKVAWLDHWTENYIRKLSRYDATDLLSTVIAGGEFDPRECLCYAADNAPELIGEKIQEAIFSYLRPAAEEAFAENDWRLEDYDN